MDENKSIEAYKQFIIETINDIQDIKKLSYLAELIFQLKGQNID